MVITKKQEEILERIVNSHPEIKKEDINTILDQKDEIYLGGMRFFGKIDKTGKLIKIITEEGNNLEGSSANLFNILFDGNIYDIEEFSEYSSLLTFGSNASGFLSVFYNPRENEFYVAPRLIEKAYKATGDNKFKETKLPEFSQ